MDILQPLFESNSTSPTIKSRVVVHNCITYPFTWSMILFLYHNPNILFKLLINNCLFKLPLNYLFMHLLVQCSCFGNERSKDILESILHLIPPLTLRGIKSNLIPSYCVKAPFSLSETFHIIHV